MDSTGTPTDPTTPDTEVSQDNGAFADAAEEVTTASGSNGMGMITLTGAETNNSTVGVAFKVASGPKATLMTLTPAVLAVVGSGTLSAGSAGGGTLGTLLAYDVTGCFLRTTGGTGGGGTGGANNQARKIVTYAPSTGVFTVTPNWETAPGADTTYDVLLPEGVTLGMLRALNPATAGRTLVVDSAGLGDANAVKLGPSGSGTPQTARDLGASVLLAASQHVIVDSGAVTTLTNLPSIPANWLTAAGIAAAALNGKGDWLLASSAPANFGALGITAGGHVSNVDTLTTYTGNTPQTGDAYAVVTDTLFGNAKLVRSTTPANTLTVDAAHKVAVTLAAADVSGNVSAVLANTAHGGAAATLRLGSSSATPAFWVTCAGGDAVAWHSSHAGSGAGLRVTADGTVAAVQFGEGDLDARGLSIQSAAGNALYIQSTLSDAVFIQAAVGDGLHIDATRDVHLAGDGQITSVLFVGITSLAQWLGLLAGKQAGDTTARTELRATGAGAGTFDETTDSLEAVRDTVGANVVAIKAKTDNLPAQPAAVGSAMVLSATGLDAVAVESDLNARQALAIVTAVAAGVLDGAGTTTVHIAAAGVSATRRLTAICDSNNNRTSVTLFPPA